LDEHLTDGTYRRDRHGPVASSILGWKPKPPTKVRASARSQRRWIRNAADERAVREGCRFNEALAEYVCEFFETFLCHSKGKWAGQAFEPTTWQREQLLYPLFGWVRSDGTRRFRRSYLEMPKKNYKSTTASGIGLYMLCADEEPGAEVYSLGADKDQARIVHREAIKMVDASPRLAACLKVHRSTDAITYPATHSVYKALSAAPRGKQGPNIHCGIYDELHEWYGDEVWNSLKYGYRARRQPLALVITNAGDDIQSVCHRQREKAQAILDGKLYDQGFFALILSASQSEAEQEIESVRNGSTELPVAARCNPALGHVIKKQDLLADIRDAIQTPSEMSNLLRLTYGVWATSTNPWLNSADWKQCARQFDEEDLAGRECYGGLDLSKTEDMTSLVLIFPGDDDTYRQLAWFWLPEETVQRQQHLVDYRTWQRDGWLDVVPGPVIDYQFLRARIAELCQKFRVLGVGFDRAYANETAQWMDEELGVEPIPFQQTIMEFASPTAEYERLVLAGRLHHNGNPLLGWQAGHVQVKTDTNNNKRPVKPKKGDIRTIDGMVAGIMALSLAIREEGPSVYDDPDKELTLI